MAQGYDTDQAFPRLGARTDTKTLFGPTMGLVAVTAALFTLGAYLARNLSDGWGVGFWIASLGCLLAMNLTVRQSKFQRLRVSTQIDSAPLLAASIFLDILNVFQFFLTLFGRTRR
jgi:hypothetical protein